jgi:hypothetical protein
MPASTFRRDVHRYAQLISDALRPDVQFVAEAESVNVLQVERGTIFGLTLRGPVSEVEVTPRVERLIEVTQAATTALAPSRLAEFAIVDRRGHHRTVYRPLLIYSWLQAFRLAYETLPRSQFGRWEEALRAWCDLLEAEITGIDWPPAGMPAARGGAATEAAWTALALWVAGKVFIRDAWTDLAGDTFGKLARGQRDSGAFLTASPSDNPETLWYHELVLLHAAASYAVQNEDRGAAAAVGRATEFHLRETQPDHATAQPWALFAFIWNERARPLADGLLHTAAVQHPGNPDGLSLMLLADALYCLRLFEPAPAA